MAALEFEERRRESLAARASRNEQGTGQQGEAREADHRVLPSYAPSEWAAEKINAKEAEELQGWHLVLAAFAVGALVFVLTLPWVIALAVADVDTSSDSPTHPAVSTATT